MRVVGSSYYGKDYACSLIEGGIEHAVMICVCYRESCSGADG